MNPVVRIQDLGVRLGGAQILSGVDIAFAPGEIHTLLGPNGSGKTTLFKAVLDAVPCSGSIESEHPDLRIGHLIEYPAFYAKLSLRENLLLHADYLGADRGEVDSLLVLVGLADRASTRFGVSSLGMRQRLGIARSLLSDPRLLLLDEPTNGLDPLGIRHVRELLCRIRDERGTAIVVSSHHLAEVSAMSDRITFLRRGRTVHETTHAGPFAIEPADDAPDAISTWRGPLRAVPCDSTNPDALDLEDLYALLLEEDPT